MLQLIVSISDTDVVIFSHKVDEFVIDIDPRDMLLGSSRTYTGTCASGAILELAITTSGEQTPTPNTETPTTTEAPTTAETPTSTEAPTSSEMPTSTGPSIGSEPPSATVFANQSSNSSSLSVSLPPTVTSLSIISLTAVVTST